MVYLENNGTSYQFISGLRAKRTITGENSSVRRRRGGLISQGARPNKNWFRSTHPTEKVWQLILIDQYLLFKIRYYVVPNCGTSSELNGAHPLKLKCPKPLWKNDDHVPAYNLSVHIVRQHVTWLSHDHFFVKKQFPLSILTCFKSCWD